MPALTSAWSLRGRDMGRRCSPDTTPKLGCPQTRRQQNTSDGSSTVLASPAHADLCALTCPKPGALER
jgi:hypothetical protein